MQKLTGREYLQAEIACKFDKTFEKKTWDERLAAFKRIDFTLPSTFKRASDPIGLRSAYIAYEDVLAGKPTGYMISLDACSSGLQLLSLLVSCPKSFDLCGGKQDNCTSAYTIIYDAMELEDDSISAKMVKDTIMTAFYGSTAMPEATFGENINLFYQTMEKTAPGAWDLNIGLQELWDEISGSVYEWVMPDNFHACIETKGKDMVKFQILDEDYVVPVKIDARPDFHKGLGPNLIHSLDGMIVREMFRRCMPKDGTLNRVVNAIYSKNKSSNGKSSQMVATLWNNFLESGFLSVRIFDYIHEDTIGLVDADEILNLFESLPAHSFDLVSVHDCFRCHPNYGDDLRQQYNTILADINDSNLLSFMAKQVAHSKITTRKVGKIDRQVILDSNYALA